MQDKTCIKCTKIAVVVDKGFPLCGDCYCKEYKLGKYEYKQQIAEEIGRAIMKAEQQWEEQWEDVNFIFIEE